MSRKGENIFKRKDGRWEARYIHHYENGKAKYYPYGYDYYLEKREEPLEETKLSKQEKVKKQAYINPLKEKEKIERKIKKIEDKISKKEEEIASLQNELTKKDIYSDYIKVGEIQEKINSLNNELEEYMTKWTEEQEKLEELGKL